MALIGSAMSGILTALQSVATSGNGHTIGLPPSFRNHILYIKGNGAVSAGAIQLESASSSDYTGTWAPIGGGPITVTANAELVYNFSGIYQFLRARISTNIVDGTVTVSYKGFQ